MLASFYCLIYIKALLEVVYHVGEDMEDGSYLVVMVYYSFLSSLLIVDLLRERVGFKGWKNL